MITSTDLANNHNFTSNFRKEKAKITRQLKIKSSFIVLFLTCIFCTHAQILKKENSGMHTKTEDTMDSSKITNPLVRKAIEALQNNDKSAWNSCFTEDVLFTDDGRILDFASFFNNAFKHKEKFLTIDKIENDGKDIYGSFYAGQWGTFKVFFKFQQQADGKLNRLDIGQTK